MIGEGPHNSKVRFTQPGLGFLEFGVMWKFGWSKCDPLRCCSTVVDSLRRQQLTVNLDGYASSFELRPPLSSLYSMFAYLSIRATCLSHWLAGNRSTLCTPHAGQWVQWWDRNVTPRCSLWRLSSSWWHWQRQVRELIILWNRVRCCITPHFMFHCWPSKRPYIEYGINLSNIEYYAPIVVSATSSRINESWNWSDH